MPFLIRRAKKAHGMEISAAPGVLVGGINARRHAAPQHDASRRRPPRGRAARPPAAQSFARCAGPHAHKLRRGVKFILWIAARNDRISVANVT